MYFKALQIIFLLIFILCYYSWTAPTSLPSTEDATKVRYEFILAGVCGAVVVIALVVFAMRNRKHPHPHTLIPLAGIILAILFVTMVA